MNKLIILDVEMAYAGISDTIHPVLICDDENTVLIDCGYVGSLPKIEAALQKNGICPQAITHVVLTHQDHDHIGAAAAFKRKYPFVTMMASAIEAPYISGSKKSLRLEQAEELQKKLPPQQQAFGEAFCGLLRSVEPVEIDRTLHDGELLPFGGGCRVIATPGHTPGHISLFLPVFETILSGDAVALDNGAPVIANPQFTLDLEEATASMARLLSYPVKRIVCYHGGVLEK
ncbi:putative metallo-hydrolase YflN [bioreactor metagenome]|uniref:Putative metallo-hydrolase YflN n=1 Tax=bioreactor metagenome TaxID=1076179 RepID=A0A644WSQ3_9ZZZZ